ncbi:MAG: hypothetical protein HYY16_00290 [Planctomycetes bacterium]|nr:hypothetical protein [Planctomycetota bacterium]
MGIEVWEASLFQGARRVTWARGVAGKNAACLLPDGLLPWRHDGGALVLAPWNPPGVVVYEVEARRATKIADRFVVSAGWAPSSGHLLLVSSNEAIVYDGVRTICQIPVETSAGLPIAGFTPSGAHVFVLARPSRGKSRIVFHVRDTGKSVRTVPFDPVDVLPYAHREYAKLHRQRSSLVLGRTEGNCGAGLLLDIWSDSRYDPATGRLRLLTYRPTSPIFRDRDEGGLACCQAEPRWVEARIE